MMLAGKEAESRNDIEQTLRSKLFWVADDAIARNISDSDFSIELLINDVVPATCYWTYSPMDAVRMEAPARLFFDQVDQVLVNRMATREKVVLCCGNVAGVTQVDDAMTVAEPADPSRWYTVVRGDTLSAISKSQYGNANDYPKIFEANKPMLTSPDKIYPGQVLRIPA